MTSSRTWALVALSLLVALAAGCGGRRGGGGRGGPLPGADSGPGPGTDGGVVMDRDGGPGGTDAGPVEPCTSTESRLTTSESLGARSPELSTEGGQLSVVYNQEFELKVGVIEGGAIATESVLHDNCDRVQRPLHWTGDSYLLGWGSGCGARTLPPGMYLSWLDSGGGELGEPELIAEDSTLEMDVAWTGSSVAAVFCADVRDGTIDSSRVTFQRFDTFGSPMGGEVLLGMQPGYCDGLTLAFDGGELAASWLGEDGVHFARLSVSGSVLSTDSLALEDEPRGGSDLVWTGSQWARTVVVYGTMLVRADGSGIAEPVMAVEGGDADRSELVWTGSGYGLVHHDYDSGLERHQLRFFRLAPDGSPVSDPTLLFETNNGSLQPESASLVHLGGGDFAAAWHDRRHETDEVYLARIACP